MRHFFMRIISSLLLVVATFENAYSAPLRQGEGIIRDQITGDFIATYWDEDETGGEYVKATLISATKIDPAVKSIFMTLPDEVIQYRYHVKNGDAAKQGIISLSMRGLPYEVHLVNSAHFGEPGSGYGADLMSAALVSPIRWDGNGARVARLKVTNLGWNYDLSEMPVDESKIDYLDGIRPGSSLTGFGFHSTELPGLIAARLVGNVGWGDKFRPLGEATTDSGIYQQMKELEDRNHVACNVAAPSVVVPVPFDPALLLDRIRTEMQTWPGKQMLDTSFAAKLDGLLTSAANAYRLNNPKAAREHIESVRKLLAKEHHNVDHDDEDDEDTEEHKRKTRLTIDRLAARVLDFDLRYVLKRTEQGHDKGGREKDERSKDDPRKR